MSEILSGDSDFQPLLRERGAVTSQACSEDLPGSSILPVHLHLPSQLQLPSLLPPLKTLSFLALSWGGERKLPDQSTV